MPSDLQNELSVPAFMEETAGRGPLHRQAAQDEQARGEPYVLPFAFAILASHLDGVDLSETPFGNDQIGQLLSEQVTRARQFRGLGVMNICKILISVVQRVVLGKLPFATQPPVTELCQNPIWLTPLGMHF